MCSSWADVSAGVPQGSILEPLLFLIYINDLSDGLKSECKLFADGTSLFSVVHDINTSASDLNTDLETIGNWAFQWKMNFNPDPNKQAQEIIFSRKKTASLHSLPRHSLITIDKTFIRLHLDYGDVIYDRAFNESFHQRLESIHYNAAITITRENLFQELGLKTLKSRRWLILHSKSPGYLIKLIPENNPNHS